MQVRLFGSFQLPGLAPLAHSKARALLTYLLLFPHHAHSREKLADLLWPEASDEAGRRGLANALHKLRQSLGEFLAVEDGAVRLLVSPAWQVDVWAFDQLVRSADTPALQNAVELYTGDLAPEIYDDWIIAPRLERRESYLVTLETLTERLAGQHQLNEALSYARCLVWAEPLREQSQQVYLRLLGRLGRRAEALAHYNDLCQLLWAELDIGPLPETQAIAADLRREAGAPLADSESLPFTGRTVERASLIQQLERLLAGQGGVVAVEGRPGLGKSRLLREVAASARWRNITVLPAPSYNRPAESPLQPLQSAFAALLSGPRRAQLELALPAETLAACAPFVPAWQTLTALPDLPPAHQRYRFQQAIGAVLAELTRHTPLLLLLDDWHWAEPLAWEYLDALVQLAPGRRLLVMVTWRRTEMEERVDDAWRTVQTWERDGRLALFALQPWTFEELTAALPPAQQAIAPRLWAISSGNPFLLTEALHALNEGRSPETDVVTRAQSLPAEARTVLDCAAVLGRALPLALWAGAAGLPPGTLATLADTLTQRYFLHVTDNGYAFAHDLVQAALYQAMPAEGHCYWHGRCAEALATLAPDQYHARAFHHDRAGQKEAAVPLYRQASEQDVHLGAYNEARTALSRALALSLAEPSQTRAEILLEVARLDFITDERKAGAIIQEALAVAESLTDEGLLARANLLAGELAMKGGRHAEARAALSQALAHAQARPGRAGLAQQAEVRFQLGELAVREGQMLVARAEHQQQLDLARQIGDQAQEAAALEGLGFALGTSGGAPDEVLGYLRRGLALRRLLGNPFKEAQSLLNFVAVVHATGRLDEIQAPGEEALRLTETIGYARGTAIVRAALALAAATVGHFDEAREQMTAVIVYFRQVNDPEAVGLYTDALGLITERAGNPEQAKAHFQEAIAILENHQSDFYAALAQMDLGGLYVRTDRYQAAEPLLTKASATFAANETAEEYRYSQALLGLAAQPEALRQQIADTCWADFQTAPAEGVERQYYLWALWQLLLATGRASEAATVLRAAYAFLQAQAARLHDPALRQSFFERVPVNREIVAAHAELAQTAAQVTARVVRSTVPLGRALTEADYVAVRWTVHAPADEAISDRSERRRFVLKRLLDEAAGQGAAPTDDDLAQALGVSRRTILRDMEALEQAGIKRATRKRK
jgi:DNA-binding SARP family transcriptional activator/tetratricopeptide (TPR) repeat protein